MSAEWESFDPRTHTWAHGLHFPLFRGGFDHCGLFVEDFGLFAGSALIHGKVCRTQDSQRLSRAPSDLESTT